MENVLFTFLGGTKLEETWWRISWSGLEGNIFALGRNC